MIIHEVQREDRGKYIRLSARIETDATGLPDTLWFEFPIEHSDMLSTSMNGFIAVLSPIVMALGERVHVRGTLSPRLLYGIREYQRILQFWYPTKLKLVEIQADRFEEWNASEPRGAMTAFSGGVDSTFTLWSHLREREPAPPHRLTHAMLVHGFDVPLPDTRTFGIIEAAYRRMLDPLDLTLIPVATNAKAFTDQRGFEWVLTHSAAVVGTALFFEPMVSAFYFPLNDTLDNALPSDGLHPALVPMLSTAACTSFPHGGTSSKLDKVRAIADWTPSHGTLRVCWERPDGLTNCGECWKCVYTMAYLAMAGALGRYTTFPNGLTRAKIRSSRFYPDLYYYYPWILRDARKSDRTDIAIDYTIAMAKSYVKNIRTKRTKCYYYPDEATPTETLYY